MEEIKNFAEKLAKLANLPIEFEPEFYTTQEADRLTKRDQGTDARAAALILGLGQGAQQPIFGIGKLGLRLGQQGCELGGSEFSLVRLHGDAERAAAFYAGADALTPDDIAETVAWSVGLPPRVNITCIEEMPGCQTPGPFVIKRRG